MGNKASSLKIHTIVPDKSHDTDTDIDHEVGKDKLTNSLWSLKTLMILIEGYIKKNMRYDFNVTIPVELIYLCSQFYGFKVLMILQSKLYTYPNMPNALKFLKTNPKNNINWVQFKIHGYDGPNIIKYDSFAGEESTFKYNKQLTQLFEYIPSINWKRNTVSSAIITYDNNIISGLRFTQKGYKGYDNDTIIDGYEFAMPSSISLDAIECKKENQIKMRYSKVNESLFATIQTLHKTYLYQLPLSFYEYDHESNNKWKWEHVNTFMLSKNVKHQKFAKHNIHLIDNDMRLWLGHSLSIYYKTELMKAMIYDFGTKQWSNGATVENEQLMEEHGNSCYNVHKNGIYCFGSRYTNNYTLYDYNLVDNKWYIYDTNALDIYKNKYHKIQQISLWNDYYSPNLLYCSVASENEIVVEFIDDRMKDKGWIIDEQIVQSIGKICDPTFIHPCFC